MVITRKLTINIHILLSHFHNSYVNETTAHTALSGIDQFIQFIQSTAS